MRLPQARCTCNGESGPTGLRSPASTPTQGAEMQRKIRGLVAVVVLLAAAQSALAISTGWRGDGPGQFPDATPPAVWSKSADGKTTNILWQTKFPHYSWASPLVVGDKVI